MSSCLFSESSGSPTPVLKKKGLSSRDVEGKADDPPKDGTSHQQEVIVKRKQPYEYPLKDTRSNSGQ